MSPEAAPGADWAPDRRDIIYIEFSPHVGREMPRTHPMAVLSTRAFNERTGIVIGLPMTHAKFHATNPFAVALADEHGAPSYIVALQPKSFDWRERRARPHPLSQVPVEAFRRACLVLSQILDLDS